MQLNADVFSLPGFLQALRRHRVKVLLTFLLSAATTFFYTINRSREYESSAKLFVRVGRETVSVDPTAEAAGQVVSVTDTQDREIHSIVSLLSNRDLLEQIVDDLGPATIFGYVEGEGDEDESKLAELIAAAKVGLKSALISVGLLENATPREIAIQIVRDSISVDTDGSSSVIKVSARAETPRLAQLLVQKLIEHHLGFHLQANSALGSLSFFSTETERLLNSLEMVSAELAEVKNKNSVASINTKRESLERQLLTLNERQTQAVSALASATATVNLIREQLLDELEFVPAAETVGMANSTSAGMRQELYRLEILESELLAKLTANHPKVSDIRQQITKARAVMDEEETQVQTTKGINLVHQQLRINLLTELANQQARQAEIDSIERERSKLKQEIATMNQGQLELDRLEREVNLLDTNYRRYVESLEQVRIQKELEQQRISNVNIVQKPSYIDYPVGPSNLVVLALGLISSFSFSCGVAVLAELVSPIQQPLRRREPQSQHRPRSQAKPSADTDAELETAAVEDSYESVEF